jgi:hypothetical protein
MKSSLLPLSPALSEPTMPVRACEMKATSEPSSLTEGA